MQSRTKDWAFPSSHATSKGIAKKVVLTPNLRHEILKELKKMIIKKHKNKGLVILMMDGNEFWVLENEGELAEFAMETQIEDIHIARQKVVPQTTYERGLQRLD